LNTYNNQQYYWSSAALKVGFALVQFDLGTNFQLHSFISKIIQMLEMVSFMPVAKDF
jgi:hypothetical protein